MNAKYYANTTGHSIPHLKYWVCRELVYNKHIWWSLTLNENQSILLSVFYVLFIVWYYIKRLFYFLAVLTNYLSVRVQGEPVLKYNTAVLRCQVPQSAASYTKIISWTRGSTRLYPSTRGGNMTLIGLFCGLCARPFSQRRRVV